MPLKTMDHARYQRALRNKPAAELNFIRNDAQEAMDANPDGENAGYYRDEILYVIAEFERRQREGISRVNRRRQPATV